MRYGPVLIALVAAILLAVTNPGPADFQAYIKGQPPGDLISHVAVTFGIEAPDVPAQRRDYVLFSLYTVERNGETRRYVGVVKQFIALK